MVRRRGRAAVSRALRLTGAAMAAYTVATWLLPETRPLLAPLTALLVVQVTLFGTLTDSLRRVVSVVAGVALAVGVAESVGFGWWSLMGLIAASIVVGQLLRLGPHLLEVPISAMLVLGVANAEAAALDRIVETLVGAGVGVAVNLLVPPSDQTRSAGAALDRYVEEIAEFLDGMAGELAAGAGPDQAAAWADDTRLLVRHAVRVERVLDQARESRRLNPRTLGTADPGMHLRTGLESLEHCAVALRALCRTVAEEVSDEPAEADGAADELRDAFAELLHEMARAIHGYGAVVRAEAESEPGEDVQDDELRESLHSLRQARERLIALLLASPRANARQWQLRDAVLATVERVLRELDAGERARRRAARWGARVPPRPRSAVHAVQRLRAGGRLGGGQPRGT